MTTLLFLAAVALHPVVAQINNVLVSVAPDAQSAAITIGVENPAAVQFEISDREILLRFPTALNEEGAEDFLALAETDPAWVAGASTGFDTLLLLAPLDTTVDVQRGNAGLVILLERTGAATQPGAVDALGQLRLDILEAQVLTATGRDAEALDLLQRLSEENPDDVDVLTNRAILESRFMHIRAADSLYEHAVELEPNNAEVRDLWEETMLIDGSQLGYEFEYRDVTDAQIERTHRLRSHVLFPNFFRLGAQVDTTRMTIADVRLEDGTFGSFRGRRDRANLDLRYDWEGGSLVGASLYALGRENTQIGGAFYVGINDRVGRTTLRADYNQPMWDFVEGIVSGGVVDHASIQREQRIFGRVESVFIFQLSRYGVHGNRNVARAAGFDAFLTIPLIELDPFLAIQYSFDGEYQTSIRAVRDPEGFLYNPIPLQSREVHSPSIFAMQEFGPMRAEGFVGYSMDRLGGRGLYEGAGLTFRPSYHFELGANFERRLDPVVTGQVVKRYVLSMVVRF